MATSRHYAILILLAVVVGVPACIWISVSLLRAYSWHDRTPRGPLVAQADWPEPIQELHASMSDTGADMESFSVYLLHGEPGQILSTVACRVDVDPAGWDAIRNKLDLQSIPDADGQSIYNAIVPLSDSTWWPSRSSISVKYFASARLLAGDEAEPLLCRA